MTDTKSTVSAPSAGQVWVPDGKVIDSRMVREARTMANGEFWVSWVLYERCPCCDTLLRAERESYGAELLDGWQEWVRLYNAVCQETVQDAN